MTRQKSPKPLRSGARPYRHPAFQDALRCSLKAALRNSPPKAAQTVLALPAFSLRFSASLSRGLRGDILSPLILLCRTDSGLCNSMALLNPLWLLRPGHVTGLNGQGRPFKFCRPWTGRQNAATKRGWVEGSPGLARTSQQGALSFRSFSLGAQRKWTRR